MRPTRGGFGNNLTRASRSASTARRSTPVRRSPRYLRATRPARTDRPVLLPGDPERRGARDAAEGSSSTARCGRRSDRARRAIRRRKQPEVGERVIETGSPGSARSSPAAPPGSVARSSLALETGGSCRRGVIAHERGRRRRRTCGSALGEPEASERAVVRAAEALGGLDLFVYTAAVARHEPALRMTASRPGERRWRATSPAASGPAARRASFSCPTGGGSILVVGSTTVYTPPRARPCTGRRRPRLKAFVEVLAIELAPSSVRANLLTPGAVETPLTAGMSGDRRELLRPGDPARSASRAPGAGRDGPSASLRPLSPYTTGAEFVVDGGIRLRPMPPTVVEERR